MAQTIILSLPTNVTLVLLNSTTGQATVTPLLSTDPNYQFTTSFTFQVRRGAPAPRHLSGARA